MSVYIRFDKQYLLSWLVWLNLQLRVVRPLLRPDIGATAELAPALKLQQSPLALGFLKDEIQSDLKY